MTQMAGGPAASRRWLGWIAVACLGTGLVSCLIASPAFAQSTSAALTKAGTTAPASSAAEAAALLKKKKAAKLLVAPAATTATAAVEQPPVPLDGAAAADTAAVAKPAKAAAPAVVKAAAADAVAPSDSSTTAVAGAPVAPTADKPKMTKKAATKAPSVAAATVVPTKPSKAAKSAAAVSPDNSPAGPTGCRVRSFLVNDYGKDGPTADAKRLLDADIASWSKSNNLQNIKVGPKSVKCEQFLNFIVFDEWTCTASAKVCWQ